MKLPSFVSMPAAKTARRTESPAQRGVAALPVEPRLHVNVSLRCLLHACFGGCAEMMPLLGLQSFSMGSRTHLMLGNP